MDNIQNIASPSIKQIREQTFEEPISLMRELSSPEIHAVSGGKGLIKIIYTIMRIFLQPNNISKDPDEVNRERN